MWPRARRWRDLASSADDTRMPNDATKALDSQARDGTSPQPVAMKGCDLGETKFGGYVAGASGIEWL